MPELEGGVSVPSEADIKNLPDADRLAQAAEAAKQAASADGIVNTLRQKAAAITNPQERERLLTEAINKESVAHGLSKKARILQSGSFQGAVSGAGIGAATSAGLGTVVGTLVGGVTSIPATLVGGLVGGGVGLIHGPWIKLPAGILGGGGGKDGKDGGEDGEQIMQVPQQAIDRGAVLVDDKTGSVTIKDPDALKDAAAAAEQAAKVAGQQQGKPDKQSQGKGGAGEKKKPKKLEVRSGKSDNKDAAAATQKQKQTTTEGKDKAASAAARRKPKKLEVRSSTKSSTAPA